VNQINDWKPKYRAYTMCVFNGEIEKNWNVFVFFIYSNSYVATSGGYYADIVK